jgi:hypothetical protein
LIQKVEAFSTSSAHSQQIFGAMLNQYLICIVLIVTTFLQRINNYSIFAQAIDVRKAKPAKGKTSTTIDDAVEQMFKEQTSSGNCDLPVLQGSLASKLFRKKFWNKSPVIIRGMASGWPAVEKWTKEYLTENFGNIKTQIGTSKGIIRAGGTGNKFVKFGDYVEAVWGKNSHLLTDKMPIFSKSKRECDSDETCIYKCEEIAISSKSFCDEQVCSKAGKCIYSNMTRGRIDSYEQTLNLAKNDDDTINRHSYGEIPYLFDRENFMAQAKAHGISNDYHAPSFFRGSEIASTTKKNRFKRNLTIAMQQRMQEVEDKERLQRGESSPSLDYIFLTPRFHRFIGVGMHQHTDGWNALLGGSGLKLWFIYPPTVRPGPEHPVERSWCCGEDSWIRTILPDLLKDKRYGPGNIKPLMCTQKVGDVIYIPEWWHHGTLSGPGPDGKGGIVGVASQLGDPSGDLALSYQARTLQRLNGDVEDIYNLFRQHIAMESTSSFEAMNRMVELIMEQVGKMQNNGTDNKVISQLPIIAEAKNLCKKILKLNPILSVILMTLSDLELLENNTEIAMKYLKKSKLVCVSLFTRMFMILIHHNCVPILLPPFFPLI